jgi:hypothetical protein
VPTLTEARRTRHGLSSRLGACRRFARRVSTHSGGVILTSRRKLRDEDPERLRQRLAQIQIERAAILDRGWPIEEEGWSEERSDLLHDLAIEEGRIRNALNLPPGEWDAGVWPDWVGWSILTSVVVGIFVLAWMAN